MNAFTLKYRSFQRSLFLIATVLFLFPGSLWGSECARGSDDRIVASFTLSGLLIFGVGYEHRFDEHHVFQATVYPFFVPEFTSFPLFFSTGYDYHGAGDSWRFKIGANYFLMMGPSKPGGRRKLNLLCLTPGAVCSIDDESDLTSQLWLARFPKENRRHEIPLPIGFDFRYSR